jgi:hypothetical protein
MAVTSFCTTFLARRPAMLRVGLRPAMLGARNRARSGPLNLFLKHSTPHPLHSASEPSKNICIAEKEVIDFDTLRSGILPLIPNNSPLFFFAGNSPLLFVLCLDFF